MQQVKEIVNNNFEEYADSVLSSCGTDFSDHFAEQAIKLLGNDRILGHDAISLIAICHIFVLATPGIYCGPEESPKLQLIPRLMFACRMQICSTMDLYCAEIFVLSALQILWYVATAPSLSRH